MYVDKGVLVASASARRRVVVVGSSGGVFGVIATVNTVSVTSKFSVYLALSKVFLAIANVIPPIV